MNSAASIGGMGVVVGIAFNGVNFDPPAPTQAILGAHTLAPMDDAGGHVNTAAGYHYHAATGKSKKITQTDGHAAMIGYAMDGYGMYENLDASGKAVLAGYVFDGGQRAATMIPSEGIIITWQQQAPTVLSKVSEVHKAHIQ